MSIQNLFHAQLIQYSLHFRLSSEAKNTSVKITTFQQDTCSADSFLCVSVCVCVCVCLCVCVCVCVRACVCLCTFSRLHLSRLKNFWQFKFMSFFSRSCLTDLEFAILFTYVVSFYSLYFAKCHQLLLSAVFSSDCFVCLPVT